MYIGSLNHKQPLTFTHIDSKVAFDPTTNDGNEYTWRWDQLFDTGVDITMALERESYIGAINFTASKDSIAEAYVLADGSMAGRYQASGGGLFGGRITIPIGVRARKLTVRLRADFKNISISSMEIFGAYDDDVPLVWPRPKSIGVSRGYAFIANVMPASDDADEIFAAEFLRQRLSEKLGHWKHNDGITVIIKKQLSYEGEHYTIKNTENKVTVSARSRIALLYGADTLLSLTSREGLYLADVDDMPSQKLRGFHFGLPHRDRIEFARLLFRYVLIPMRYNVVFLEFAGGMRFDRHPEISEGWLRAIENAKAGKQPFMPHSDKVSNRSLLEKSDVKKLVGYIKELGLALVPEVQSLAHVQYITYAHPDIAEKEETTMNVDMREADATPSSFYEHSYCPSNPKSYEIIYDIIDEIVEVSEPDGYVHMGHDEVYQIGLCPKCREKDKSTLFADHVIAMHDYLAQKGLKMMMWSDMLHPAPITKYDTHREIDRLPRDIIMMDFIWYFHPSLDIEDSLLSHGFKVVVGNLYSSHYPRFSARCKKDGMLGGEVSMWLVADEEILAKNGKLWDIMYLSEMLWNSDNYEETNRRTYNEIISKYIQPATRDNIRGKFCPNGYTETGFEVMGESSGIPRELLALCSNAKRADSIEIITDDRYDRLVFEHATINTAQRIVWEPHVVIGEFIMEYSDGTHAIAEVRYAENTMCYKGGYAIPKHQSYYRHFGYVGTWFSDPVFEGKNERGEDMTIWGYIWENPHPSKKIVRITYKPREDDFCRLVVVGVRGLKRNVEDTVFAC